MKPINLNEVRKYVNENIDSFHESRIRAVSATRLETIVKKNPYLLRAKNVVRASDLVDGALSARLSSSEEELFGAFLEGLAIFVAEQTTGGHKSGVTGVDLEFDNKGVHYFISIKSGINWGNADQHDKLESNLRKAIQVYSQRQGQKAHADAVLGICYGKTRTSRLRGYLKIVGQNFWAFISGNDDLYKEIIEPIGYKAKEHNDNYNNELGKITNKLTLQFAETYCNKDGSINWNMLIEATCGNYDLDKQGL